MPILDNDLPIGGNLYDSGIEPDEERDILDDPFNPEEISIDSKLVSMDNCLRRLIQGTIVLNPDFQRNEVWTNEKKSQLIESLMLKIPLPMFYVSADERNNYTVVDGLQRLSTIRSFVLGDKYLSLLKDTSNTMNAEAIEAERGFGFRLEALEFWGIYDGATFNDLPVHIRNNILDTEFRFTVINPGTPEEVRRNIFKRINTGGLPLSSQEIRNALYIGMSTRLLNELSNYQEFKLATGGSIKSLRMEDKELILRFLSFLIRDYTTYRRTINADKLMSDTMIIINAMPDLESRELRKLITKEQVLYSDISISHIDELREFFRLAMSRAVTLFGRHTFRKSYGDRTRSPINKALFETWGVLLCKLTEEEFNQLLTNRDEFFNSYHNIIEDYEFQLYISRDSMKVNAVRLRFERLNNLIQNCLL